MPFGFIAAAKESTPSLGVRLLADLKQIFGTDECLATETILELLMKIEEAPWLDLRGKPLDSRRLANYLNPYGIKSKLVRIGQAVARGYRREDLHDAWSRYLGPAAKGAVTSVTSATTERDLVTHVTDVTDSKSATGEKNRPENRKVEILEL